MSKIVGTYILESSSNLDEYLTAKGAGLEARKVAHSTTPTVTFTEKDGVYTMTITSEAKYLVLSFTPGVEFDEIASDGRQCKTTFTKESENKLVQIQKGLKGRDTKYTREFTDTHMNMDVECDGATCQRYFKRV